MNNKKHIKILFVDFWDGFIPESSYFYELLLKNYHVSISTKPDLLFYSVFGNCHREYNCTKILFIGENQRPDFSQCDFSFSFDYINDDRNYRLPLYAIYDDVKKLIGTKHDIKKILELKKKFCCFLVSNPGCEIRNQFFKDLSKFKKVDSGGLLYNNIGGSIENKRKFIKEYKFVISFENTSYPGYVTEKIFEPLLENCVPIYWGTELVNRDFNTKRFINCHDFDNFNDVINHILLVDANDDLYVKYLNEPAFVNDELNEFVREENVILFLQNIINYTYQRSIPKYIKQSNRVLYFQLRRFIGTVKRKILRK
ncbi:glycosyltransferase family 10 domain-containing protein [Pedobacter lithocola]|uniref:Glycosyltransferase family 10 domain-containing protein n=1 Tax=Pedobacter lithocola TaxID=1908239 RepID=A0ABV8P8P1_9SPHI